MTLKWSLLLLLLLPESELESTVLPFLILLSTLQTAQQSTSPPSTKNRIILKMMSTLSQLNLLISPQPYNKPLASLLNKHLLLLPNECTSYSKLYRPALRRPFRIRFFKQ